MSLQHFFIHQRYLGSRTIPPVYQTSLGPQLAYSVCWFCPQCGDIWARLVVEDTKFSQCWSRSCAKHGGGLIDSESRFELLPCTLEADWPDEAIRYTLLQELASKHYATK